MKRFVTTLLLCMFAAPAYAAHGIALWGELKYPASFQHFDYVNPAAPKGGTLKLSANASFDSMNPFILKGMAAPGVAGFVYQSLMVQSYDEPQSYYPLIASSITLAPDRSYADFTLNPSARWSDGKPITSADVVWSFTTLKTKGHPSFKVQFKPITIEALGEHAVRFHFADKAHRELPLIAASMPVLPQHYFCKEDSGFGIRDLGKKAIATTDSSVSKPQSAATASSPESRIPTRSEAERGGANPESSSCVPFDKTTLAPPLGSGPYAVSAVEPGRSVTLTRVKNYWAENLPSQKGLNNFDTIRYDVYRDDTVALEGIKSHQFDFYEEFIARNWATAYDVPAVKSGDLIKTLIPHQIPRGMQGFIFNTRLPKFADVRVREAIGLSLDFEWMNQTLFYGAYARGRSYFNHTEFEANGLPDAAELKLLTPYRCKGGFGIQDSGFSKSRKGHPASLEHELLSSPNPESRIPNPLSCLPSSVFTTPYTVPTTDGAGIARANLIRAQKLLDDAGWVMRDGARVNAKTGEKMEIEFLMTQRTFERVIAIMKHNLRKLGITASFRYVDASQYQKRLERKQFDMVSVWWNQGLFYPSTEQYLYWHSSQADIEGSQNLGGVKNAAVDALVEDIQNAQQLDQLRPAARALDRVLTQEHYIIPHWNLNAWRVAYWNQFGRPKVTPAYNLGIDSWWAKELEASGATRSTSPLAGEATRLNERSEFGRSGEGALPSSNSPNHRPLTQPSPAGGEGFAASPSQPISNSRGVK